MVTVTGSGVNPQNPQEIKSMKRTKEIKIRLTDEEHQKLQELKIGDLAGWMRDVCLNKKTKRRNPPPTVEPALLRQLAAIGNNLNQLARNANTGNTDALQLLVGLDSIEQQLKKLRADHDSQNI